MTKEEPVYWPWKVIPENELMEEHRQEIRFLEAAYKEGFRPCEDRFAGFQASSGQGR